MCRFCGWFGWSLVIALGANQVCVGEILVVDLDVAIAKKNI